MRHKGEAPGIVAGINPLEIGLSCISLGAGRQAVTDELNYSAGVLLAAKMGEEIPANGLLCTIYTDIEDYTHPVERIQAAFSVVAKGSPEASAIVIPELISHRVTSKSGVEPWARCFPGSNANGTTALSNGTHDQDGSSKRRKLEH